MTSEKIIFLTIGESGYSVSRAKRGPNGLIGTNEGN